MLLRSPRKRLQCSDGRQGLAQPPVTASLSLSVLGASGGSPSFYALCVPGGEGVLPGLGLSLLELDEQGEGTE